MAMPRTLRDIPRLNKHRGIDEKTIELVILVSHRLYCFGLLKMSARLYINSPARLTIG